MVSETNPSLRKFQEDLQRTVYGSTEPRHCVECKQPFSPDNTHTLAGWKETKISGMCEKCWDTMFSKDGES